MHIIGDRGTYTTGFTFSHADRVPYGATQASPARAKVLAEALQVLLALGFKQRESQAMIDAARPHVGDEAKLEEVVRAALARATLPSGIGMVRESFAGYERLVA